MIHCIALFTPDGTVALCQHYDRSSADDQTAWETTIASVVFVEDGGCVRDAAFRSDCVRVVGSKFVYIRGVEGVLVAITGSDEHDETSLRGVMDVALEVITAACDGKFSAAQVTKFHGKVAMCLQEMVFEGTIMHTDVERIMQMSKLKPVKLKT